MVGQNHCILVEVYVVSQYTIEYYTILVFYVGMRSEFDYNDNLYCVDDMLRVYYSHAGHRWRGRDELIRDVLLWTPTHDRAKAGRPARTYIQQLCEDTGCCPEDLPRAMNDREEWRERVRDIRATSAT